MRVLIADDGAVSRRLLQLTLGALNYEVIAVDDGEKAWAALNEGDAPEIAILDWMMPGMDGTEVVKKIRAREGHPYVYMLLLTSRTSKEDLIEGFECGADDYLSKPLDQVELELRLRVGLRILELQRQLTSANKLLQDQASHDTLTGLLNRNAMTDAVNAERSRCIRERGQFAIILIDVDHFKEVNDRYGHHAGDLVLKEVADRLLQSARPYDSVSRHGGEEFAILACNCDLQQGIAIAERMRKRIADESIAADGRKIPLTISAGVSSFPDSGGNFEELFKVADEGLYCAKSSGRNTVRPCPELNVLSYDSWAGIFSGDSQ